MRDEPTQTEPTERGAAGGAARLRGIEGLRAVAAVSILVYHTWNYAAGAPGAPELQGALAERFFPSLRAGVTLFFVLSGFLLYRPFAAAAIRGTRLPSLSRYAKNRVLRIFPAYWVILLLVAILFQRDLLREPLRLLGNLLLLQNYVPAWSTFDGWSGLGIGSAWSLGVELIFYLVLPFAGLLAWRLGRRPRRPRVAAALWPIALLVGVGIVSKLAYRESPGLGQVWEQGGFPIHADWFAAGMALAVARVLWEDRRLRRPRGWAASAVVSAAVLTAVSAKLWYGGTLLWNEYQSVVGVAIALLISVIVLPRPDSRAVAVLAWRPLNAAGLASYSIFLWNEPLIRALRDHGLTVGGPAGFIPNLLIVLAVVGVLSWLTYTLVERPALALKDKRLPSTRPAPVAVTALAAAGVEEAPARPPGD